MHLPGWPGGDPGALEDAAGAWLTLSQTVTQARTSADTAMADLLGSWQGSAATSFGHDWHQFSGNLRKAEDGWGKLAGGVKKAGQDLQSAHSRYEHEVEIAAATAVTGLCLSLVTGFLSDAAATAAEGTILATIGEIIDGVVDALATVGGLINVSGDVVFEALTQAVIGFTTSMAGQAALEELNGDHLHLSITKALESGGAGLLAGLAGGAFTAAGASRIASAGFGALTAADLNLIEQDVQMATGDRQEISAPEIVFEGIAGGVDGAVRTAPEDGAGGGEGDGDGAAGGSDADGSAAAANAASAAAASTQALDVVITEVHAVVDGQEIDELVVEVTSAGGR